MQDIVDDAVAQTAEQGHEVPHVVVYDHSSAQVPKVLLAYMVLG